MSKSISLQYGNAQHLLSPKMQQSPFLAFILNRIVGYTNIGNYARAEVFKDQISKLDLKNMNNILDLGCGYGENAIMMSSALKDKSITAIDIDSGSLLRVKNAKSKLNLNNLTIHYGELKTVEQTGFDLIYSVDVFEHIPENEMPFAEAFKKLNSGGCLFVKMPNKIQSTVFPEKYFGDHKKWVDHEHPGQVYLLKDLEERFEREGFTVIFAFQTDGYFARLAWEIAYFMKKAGWFTQILSLPLCKLLVKLDKLVFPKGSSRGNAITVIGRKP